MHPVTWEPLSEGNNVGLGTWTWRNQQFHFPKHSTDVDVMIHYLRSLLEIDDVNTVLHLNNCRVVLAKRCAALAARYGNSNPTRAEQLDQEAQYFMNLLTGIEVRNSKQNTQGVERGRGWREDDKARCFK